MEESRSPTTAIVPSPYRRILVPHDGSEMSDRALNHALYVAKMANGEIVIFHVMESDSIPPSTLLAFIKPGSGLAEARDQVRTIFEGAIGRCLKKECKQQRHQA